MSDVAPLPRWLPALKLVVYVAVAALMLSVLDLDPLVRLGIVLVFILPIAAAVYELATGKRAGRRRLTDQADDTDS